MLRLSPRKHRLEGFTSQPALYVSSRKPRLGRGHRLWASLPLKLPARQDTLCRGSTVVRACVSPKHDKC